MATRRSPRFCHFRVQQSITRAVRKRKCVANLSHRCTFCCLRSGFCCRGSGRWWGSSLLGWWRRSIFRSLCSRHGFLFHCRSRRSCSSWSLPTRLHGKELSSNLDGIVLTTVESRDCPGHRRHHVNSNLAKAEKSQRHCQGPRTVVFALSVSICTTTSSMAAYSPASFRNATTVPSVIESPISGT